MAFRHRLQLLKCDFVLLVGGSSGCNYCSEFLSGMEYSGVALAFGKKCKITEVTLLENN